MSSYHYAAAYIFAVIAGLGVNLQMYPLATYCGLMVVVNVGEGIASVIIARNKREAPDE